MLTSPHKEKMTCDDCHQTFCKGDIIAHYRSNAVRYCHMNCDLRSHGTPACRPKKEKREDAGKCKSCGGPSTYDPKRYQGGTFCENKGCPAYQEIPAAEEGGECERCSLPLATNGYCAGDYVCDGKCGTELAKVLNQATDRYLIHHYKAKCGLGQFNGNGAILYIRQQVEKYIDTLLSRTRKEAEEKAWRAAVEALEEKRTDYSELKSFTKQGRNIGWNSARQQLITAAKERGVDIEV